MMLSLNFMDSKAKIKEQTPIDWNRKWRKKTAGHRARLSVIEEPPTTTIRSTYVVQRSSRFRVGSS